MKNNVNQNSSIFSVDHNDIFDHKYWIDPGDLFNIIYYITLNGNFAPFLRQETGKEQCLGPRFSDHL